MSGDDGRVYSVIIFNQHLPVSGINLAEVVSIVTSVPRPSKFQCNLGKRESYAILSS